MWNRERLTTTREGGTTCGFCSSASSAAYPFRRSASSRTWTLLSRLGGPALRRFVDDVRALGLKVLITELDVNDTQITGGVQDRDAVVARCYSDYLLEVVPPGHVDRVIFWTATDKGNWLNSVRAPNSSGLTGSASPGIAGREPEA